MRDERDRAPRLASWLPDEAVRAMEVERTLHSNESYTDLSRRLMKENLPIITMSMINLAIYGEPAERISAGKYLMDANDLGRDSSKMESGKHAWEEVFEAVLVEADGIKKGKQ